jgi:hypothetical protein
VWKREDNNQPRKSGHHPKGYHNEIRSWRKEVTEACLESKEPTSVEVESLAVHEEVLKEEAAVETFRAMKERYEDLYLDVGRLPQRDYAS